MTANGLRSCTDKYGGRLSKKSSRQTPSDSSARQLTALTTHNAGLAGRLNRKFEEIVSYAEECSDEAGGCDECLSWRMCIGMWDALVSNPTERGLELLLSKLVILRSNRASPPPGLTDDVEGDFE